MRTNILPSELQVGDRVAVGRHGSWRVSSQGVYVVAKVNKLKVVLKREGDGYERTWSVKRNVEVKQYASTGGKYEDNNTFIESVEAMEARNAKYQHEAMVNSLWRDAEEAAKRKNMTALKDIVAQLETFIK